MRAFRKGIQMLTFLAGALVGLLLSGALSRALRAEGLI
jgi:hypothetical protein